MKKINRILAVIALLLLAVLWMNWQLWGLKVTETDVTVAKLPNGFDGTRIVHLSDLHGHDYGEKLLTKVKQAQPELIFLTGDFIDQAEQTDTVVALAKELVAIAPTYYVTGNHEWATKAVTVKALKADLADAGVTVLTNRYVLLERNGDTMVLAGVDDPNGYADQKKPDELAAEIEQKEPGQFTVLLAHRNNLFPTYAALGYDLVFSGHGHGGIVRLPFTDGLLGSDREFFPTYTAGVYTEGTSTLFVSRGLGNNTVPVPGFRLFNRPDLAVVTLHTP